MNQQEKKPEERQVELLEELVKWTKVANYDKVKDVLEKVLDKDNKRKAYMLTGKEPSRDVICKKAKINKNTLSALWKQCEMIGLAVRKGGKITTFFDLKDFGLEPKE